MALDPNKTSTTPAASAVASPSGGDFTANFSSLFQRYLEKASEIRRINMSKLEKEIDGLIARLIHEMKRLKDAVLSELDKGE